MDALALLCNLHADGPTTARRLREAGCQTLRDLELLTVPELARLLDTPPDAARRFAQEGRILGQRAGSALLEAEDEIGLPAARPAPIAGAPTATAATTWSPTPPRPGDRETRFPTAHFPTPHTPPPAPAGRGNHEFPSSRRPPEGLTEGLARTARGGTAIEPGILEGLDLIWCEDLRGQGIATLEELAEAQATRLARRIGRAMTSVMDLQILAQRVLDAMEGPPARTVTIAPRPSPAIGRQAAGIPRTYTESSLRGTSTLPGISSLSSSVHSISELFPKKRDPDEPSSGGPFA